VLGNDGDPDGPGLAALLVTGPSNGWLALDAGGSFTAGFGPVFLELAEAEIYEPATGSWIPVESLGTPRGNHTATLLPDGTILVAGGGVLGLASAERFASE
jgi:hypothetical protein